MEGTRIIDLFARGCDFVDATTGWMAFLHLQKFPIPEIRDDEEIEAAHQHNTFISE